MRWFTRATASRFPADILSRLELLGRYQLDMHHCGIDSSEIWPVCVAPFWQDASDDRDGFLADLYALTAADEGGFVTYGAACLVWELVGSEALHIPSALPLIDAGIDFKLVRGLTSWNLTGYEMRRLDERGANR